ncbi:hypothetical protein ACQKWADRAFT_329497 [Trichoderma austrokoningii]
MKQTHRKVRSGCITCRKRRIKCDELKPRCTQCQRLFIRRGQPVNCSSSTPQQTTSQTRLPETDNAWILSTEATVAPLSLDFSLTIAQFGWPNPMLPDEKILLHHLCAIRKDMNLVAERGFSVGISQFSRFLAMAGKFEHLRHCLCGISAAHLRTVTRSSHMVPLEDNYRLLAIHGMAREMQSLAHQTCEYRQEISQGLIASSILMAWYSPNPHEYSSYLQGKLALVENATAASQESPHIMQTPHFVFEKSQDETSLDSASRLTEENHRLLESVSKSIRSFCKCKLDTELEDAARDLLNFLHNVRTLPGQHGSLENQLSIMFPIRSWLRLMPRSPDRFASDDFLIYLYLANYETAMLTMGILLPAVNLPLEIEERSFGVAKLQLFIQEAVDARLVSSESVVNSRLVYTACMEWLTLADKCMRSYRAQML